MTIFRTQVAETIILAKRINTLTMNRYNAFRKKILCKSGKNLSCVRFCNFSEFIPSENLRPFESKIEKIISN